MSVNFPAGVVMKLTTEIPNNFDAYYEAARKAQPEINLANRLGITERTLRRWKSGEVVAPQLAVEELQRLLKFGMSDSRRGSFKFIDLFAGIGGIRLAFESVGGQCVFTSEWDDYAQKTYVANFSAGHEINGDITLVDEEDIPDHDVLLGGLPQLLAHPLSGASWESCH